MNVVNLIQSEFCDPPDFRALEFCDPPHKRVVKFCDPPPLTCRSPPRVVNDMSLRHTLTKVIELSWKWNILRAALEITIVT